MFQSQIHTGICNGGKSNKIKILLLKQQYKYFSVCESLEWVVSDNKEYT